MKFIAISLLILVCYYSGFGQQKRGIAYGHHSPQDLEVLSPEISWWYNWSEAPESSVAGIYGNYGFDFVPMTWNGSFNEANLQAFLAGHPETKYLLAFNEPNFIDQANLTPSQVAAHWSRLESIADDYNLKIVGPAVNYCGNCVEENGTTYTDPFEYLDDFFAACSDCRVDYIAVHSYMNTVSALQWYIGEFKKYGKPIWLTEFAGWESNGNINNFDDQISFMIGAVDYLESDPDVFRYSWFIGRGSGILNYPYIDILGANGELTELGKVYKQMPVHDADKVVDIPARIEAEEYNTMSGVLLEKTTDESGFANVGYIDAGDWLEYRINVPNDNSYAISFRVASTKNSTLNILIDETNRLTQNFNNTGGWQVWTTVSNDINLTKGTHTLRLQAVIDGFNLNWFKIGDVVSNFSKHNHVDGFVVYPNPNNGFLKMKASKEVSTIKVFDMMGKRILELPFSEMLNLNKLIQGFYVLKAFDKRGRMLTTKQIIIE